MKISLCILLAVNNVFFPDKPVNHHQPNKEWVCQPCGQDCDKEVYDKPGTCPVCFMPLVKKTTVVFKNISPEQIAGYIRQHAGVVLIDVRTKEEFEGKANPDFGTLRNAINVPVQQLESRLPSLEGLKKKDILVYCSHGHRSEVASYILTQHGFDHVTNMTGGMHVMHDRSIMVNAK